MQYVDTKSGNFRSVHACTDIVKQVIVMRISGTRMRVPDEAGNFDRDQSFKDVV